MTLIDYHARFFAHELTKRCASDSMEKLAGAVADAQVDLNPPGGRGLVRVPFSEYIGESYFKYLADLPDLVLIMDESHRYRASAGVRAINDLKPVIGLELTAAPFVETARGPRGKYHTRMARKPGPGGVVVLAQSDAAARVSKRRITGVISASHRRQ